MNDVVIITKNKDFAEVVSALVSQELGVACHIAEEPAASARWPDAARIEQPNQPVRVQEILASVRSFLHADAAYVFGPYRFLPQQKTLHSSDGDAIKLTDKESQLLIALLKASDRGLKKDQLLTDVWGAAATELESHALETHIYRLRAKLESLSLKNALVATENGYKLII